MPVVHQTPRDRLAHAGLSHLRSKDSVDQGGLADTGLAKHGEVEAPQGGERLGESLAKEGLHLTLAQVLCPGGLGRDGIRLVNGHGFTVCPAGYRGRVFRIAAVLAAVAVLVTVAAAGTLLSLGGVDFLRDSRVIAVPADLKPVILEAAQRCPVVPASVLAAQLASESSWDPRAVSPAGASGIAQFMPEVWDQYAVDGDGDGIIDIWNPVDAIHSAAELNCVNATLVADVPGDRLNNILAAYNAGFNQVVRYEGVPPFPETQEYVERVLSRAERIQLD